jgi:DNA-directed RNA polymerase specialized sigma24 family protein
MATVLNGSTSLTYDLHSEKTWVDLISILRPYARYFVYSAHVGYWYGQEEHIIEDVVQETVRRILERSQQAERGEASPIYSLEHMSVRIAHNYCIDKMRRDCRLQLTFSINYFLEGPFSTVDEMNPFEKAIEHVYQEELFARLAQEIAQFPKKQRRALLIDLANRMYFDTQPTPLQEAFLTEGIDLQVYQQPLPDDITERTNQTALASLAYKRVGMLMRDYMLVK